MQLTLEQYESIQNYLDGIMTAGEQEEFLNELNQNSFLKEILEFEKDLRQNLISILDKKNLLEKDSSYFEEDNNFENAALIRSLIEKSGNEWKDENKRSSLPATIYDKTTQRKTKIIQMNPWIISTAAACIFIAVISLKWFIPESVPPTIVQRSDTSGIKKDTNTGSAITAPHDTIKNVQSQIPKINFAALFKKYYAKDLASPQMPDVLAMVPDNYKNDDYSFQQIILDNQPHVRGSAKDINSPQNILQLGHYYKGLSFIETSNNKQAIENLQWVIDSAQNHQLKIKAQWYLALVYLKESNTKKLIPLLSSLSTNSKAIPYNRQAREILEAIKQNQEQK
jgi:hypothetical protein